MSCREVKSSKVDIGVRGNPFMQVFAVRIEFTFIIFYLGMVQERSLAAEFGTDSKESQLYPAMNCKK